MIFSVSKNLLRHSVTGVMRNKVKVATLYSRRMLQYRKQRDTYAAFTTSSKIEDEDDETAWIPPYRNRIRDKEKVDDDAIYELQNGLKKNHNIYTDDDRVFSDKDEDIITDDFEFKSGFIRDGDGKMTEFIDVEEIFKNNPDLLQQLAKANEDNSEELVVDANSLDNEEVTGEIDDSDLEEDVGKISQYDKDIPDWGWARRKKEKASVGGRLMKPNESAAARYRDGVIPTIENSLLTTDEIVTSISILGGEDVTVLQIGHLTKMADAFVIATCRSPVTMRLIADTICKSMRNRGLHKMGVIGAKSGCEGRDSDDWIVVDCQNIVVHLQDAFTRQHIALEDVWGGEGGEKLCQVNVQDDDEIDDYVRENPVPDAYVGKLGLEVAAMNLKKKNFNLRKSKTSRSQRMKKRRR